MPIDDYYKMQKHKKPFGIGQDIFANMGRAYYVDKTLFVRDIIYSETDVILFTRPRRFGKTLNMTMLQTFFEKPLDGKDTSHYFKNLKIWQAGDEYRAEQGKRPAIMLSFKDMKMSSFELAYEKFMGKISNEYKRHRELQESNILLGFITYETFFQVFRWCQQQAVRAFQSPVRPVVIIVVLETL